MLQVLEAESAGFLFQWGNQALIEADGSPTLAAYNMVVVMFGFLEKKEFFAANEDLLDQTGFEQGVENPVDRGSVASLGANPLVNLLRGKRMGDLC